MSFFIFHIRSTLQNFKNLKIFESSPKTQNHSKKHQKHPKLPKSPSQSKTLSLPPWNSNKPLSDLPPKPSIKLPVLRMKKVKIPTSITATKSSESVLLHKKKAAIQSQLDFMKQLREKRKARCKSEQRSSESSFKSHYFIKDYYNWDKEIKNAKDKGNFKRILIQAQELEDRATRGMVINNASKHK